MLKKQGNKSAKDIRTVGILQPGYLPWLGFFEQLYRCDVFVIYDDVQFEKGSWRNRNRIKTSTGVQWLTVPVLLKGLDFPSVTLVGVISADTILSLPDLRAGERTFQLLSQVTGRAGRGCYSGTAIIQTYMPEHYAISAAAENDYPSFYQKELVYRQQLHTPPFTRLARLIYSNTNNSICQRESKRMYQFLKHQVKLNNVPDIHLIGPSPTYTQKVRGKFRWQITIRGANPSLFLADIPLIQGWTVDIDPVSLL